MPICRSGPSGGKVRKSGCVPNSRDLHCASRRAFFRAPRSMPTFSGRLRSSCSIFSGDPRIAPRNAAPASLFPDPSSPANSIVCGIRPLPIMSSSVVCTCRLPQKFSNTVFAAPPECAARLRPPARSRRSRGSGRLPLRQSEIALPHALVKSLALLVDARFRLARRSLRRLARERLVAFDVDQQRDIRRQSLAGDPVEFRTTLYPARGRSPDRPASNR